MTSLAPPTETESRTLIDALLAEQRDLSAVTRFSQWQKSCGTPALARHYEQLIPLSKPGPGEQYAFEVDLDKCSGCKACVSACHSLNGLDEHETWRSTGLLIGGTRAHSHLQTVTTACHHCADPGCMNGCPVLAYDKDPLTGIVRHLDDQCIGCQYCVLMCPYEVPQYSEARGIVRKCDMCQQRLSHGEAPACVQACPDEAIRITVVKKDEVRTNYRTKTANGSDFLSNKFLPGSPNPAITLPTTRYISSRPVPANLIAADAYQPRVQHTHLPLVWMLVFTQFGAGGFAVLPFIPVSAQPALAVIALAALLLGLGGSVLHLGKPFKAWRAFLGLRRSWLSREIVIFGAFAPLAMTATASCFVSAIPEKPLLLAATALVGLLGVFCSGMIYHVTQRDCWRGELSLGRFFSTSAMLGLATAWCALTIAHISAPAFVVGLVLVTLLKLSREQALLRLCPDDANLNEEMPLSPLGRSAFLMRFHLGLLLRSRFACAWLGGVVLPALGLLSGSSGNGLAATALTLCLAGELAERALFFKAVATVKMPGGVAA